MKMMTTSDLKQLYQQVNAHKWLLEINLLIAMTKNDLRQLSYEL